jgi:hypothetical protein
MPQEQQAGIHALLGSHSPARKMASCPSSSGRYPDSADAYPGSGR